MFDFGDIVSGVKNGSIFWTMRKREAAYELSIALKNDLSFNTLSWLGSFEWTKNPLTVNAIKEIIQH